MATRKRKLFEKPPKGSLARKTGAIPACVPIVSALKHADLVVIQNMWFRLWDPPDSKFLMLMRCCTSLSPFSTIFFLANPKGIAQWGVKLQIPQARVMFFKVKNKLTTPSSARTKGWLTCPKYPQEKQFWQLAVIACFFSPAWMLSNHLCT